MTRPGVLRALAVAFLVASATAPAAASNRTLVETVDLSGIAVSPDGRTVVFRQDHASLQENRRYSDWWLVAADGAGAARRVADGGATVSSHAGTVIPEQPKWSADSQHFYTRIVMDGAAQVWRIGRDDGPVRITDEAGNIESFTLDPASERLLITIGAPREAIARAEQDECESGIRIDPTIDVSQGLFRAGELEGRPVSQRLVGGWFQRATLLADAPKRQKIVDARTGKASEPTAEDLLAFAPYVQSETPLGASRQEKSQRGDAVRIVGRRGERHIEVSSQSGETQRCAAELCRRADFVVWRPGHDEVVFASHDAAQAQTLYRWRPGSDEFPQIAGSEGLLNGGRTRSLPCAVGEEAAFCVEAGPMAPPQLVRLELKSGARRTLAAPNATPPEAAAVRVARLDWKDGAQSFAGQLFLPRSATTPLPLFVTYYNCEGYLRGGTGDEYPFAAMAADGIAALCINQTARLEGDDAVADYDTALRGIRAAIRLLAARGVVDPKRVGQGGLSFGSEVTAWVAWHSDLLAAASVASPQMEATYYWFNGFAGRPQPRNLRERWKLGSPDETPAQWNKMSAAANVRRIRTPLLMQLPEQEFRLNMELFTRLSHTRTPVEMYAFPGSAHIKWQPRQKLAVYERNLDWFRFWLQGWEDPDPAKVAQYLRWRRMRAAQPS